MLIARQHCCTRAQSADCDDDIGQRQNPAGTIQIPREILRFLPGTMIHRDVDKKIEECRQIGARAWTNDAAQYLASDDIACDQLGWLEILGQGRYRIDAGAEQMNVNRRINEDHAWCDILPASPQVSSASNHTPDPHYLSI